MCRLYEWLYALIPVRRVRARLLRSHIESCGRCRAKFESAAGLETAAALPDWITAEESLWPAVRERILSSTSALESRRFAPDRFGRRRAWAVAAALAGILLVVVAGFLWFGPASEPGGPTRVSVVRAESNGQKADVFFYQTREASYAWVAGPAKK
jgi:hypothetical protein